ncbi:MAG: RNA polymerase sigma factor [Wenzhouxiangella sp.]
MNQAEHDMLVINAQDGSRRALDALVRHHHQHLLRFAYSLCRDTVLAQDAVQDAWIKVAGRLRGLEDPRAFRGWIYHAVRWRVGDLQRRARRSVGLPDEAEAATDLTATRDTRLDLSAAIEALPGVERQALQLFYVSGLTIPEIAVVLDIPAGTVKSRLYRARGLLKDHFKGDDDEH